MSSKFIVQNRINENGMIPVIDEDTAKWCMKLQVLMTFMFG